MSLDRSALKARARDVIATSNPRVITVGLLYLTITLILSALSARVMAVNISESEVMNYLRYAADGNYTYALKYAETMQPPGAAYFIHALLTLLSGVVGAGTEVLSFGVSVVTGATVCTVFTCTIRASAISSV